MPRVMPKWEDRETKVLRQLWGHVHVDCIAERLGRSPGAVLKRVYKFRLGRVKLPWSEEEDRELMRLSLEGQTFQFVGRVQRTRRAVEMRLHRLRKRSLAAKGNRDVIQQGERQDEGRTGSP